MTSTEYIFGPLIILDPPREFTHFCDNCEAETRHVADLECSNGSIAYCVFCGEEKLISFSRTTVGEVA